MCANDHHQSGSEPLHHHGEKNSHMGPLVISLCLYIGLIPSKTDVYSLFSKALLLYLSEFFFFCLSVNEVVGGRENTKFCSKVNLLFHLINFSDLSILSLQKMPLSLPLCLSLSFSLVDIHTRSVCTSIFEARAFRSHQWWWWWWWCRVIKLFFPFGTRKCEIKKQEVLPNHVRIWIERVLEEVTVKISHLIRTWKKKK